MRWAVSLPSNLAKVISLTVIQFSIGEAARWLSSGLGVDCSSNVRQCNRGVPSGEMRENWARFTQVQEKSQAVLQFDCICLFT